jgi:hypothetical protein
VRRSLLLLFAIPLPGCRACANDHPYVPPVASASASAAVPEPERPPEVAEVAEPALVAPPGTTSWQVGGITLEVGGREIVQAVLGDFDGDGEKDAIAIVRTAKGTADLFSFRRGIPASIMTGPPMPVHPSCTPVLRLERIGPRAAFAEMGASCTRAASARAIVVVRLSPAPAVSFDAIIVDPDQAPKVDVNVTSADRDGDGLDDVVLRVASEKLEAKLAFFDRPAGPSRDPEEPEASLKAIAAQATQKAAKAKDAPAVPPLVQDLRALYRAMCLEGGAPRITKIHGASAVACGSMRALEDAGVAEVRAFVTQGDVLRAFAAAKEAQTAPATKTNAKSAELQKLLADAAPTLTAAVRTSNVVPDAPKGRHPEWGPLFFEPGGKLMVRRGKSVSRIDPETGEGDIADAPPWRAEVVSPDGKSRFLEAYHACEGVGLHTTFAPLDDGDMTEVLIPIAPRLGKTCAGRGEPASVVPLSWGEHGLEAIVAGQLIAFEADKARIAPAFGPDLPPPGSARSAGGKAFVLPIDSGILLRGRGPGWMTVKSPDLEPYSELRSCVVTDDASRVACVRRGQVVIATLP